MDRYDWYFDDLVDETQMDTFTDDIEAADQTITRLIYGFGLADAWHYSGSDPVETRVLQQAASPSMHLTILGPHEGFDKAGRKVAWTPAETDINAAVDYEGTPITSGLTAGHGRWVSLFAVYDRLATDPEIDGNGNSVNFRLTETVKFILVCGPVLDLVGGVGGVMPEPSGMDFPAAPASTSDYPYADALRLDSVGVVYGTTALTDAMIVGNFRDDFFRDGSVVCGSINALIEVLVDRSVGAIDWTQIEAPASMSRYPTWATAVDLYPGVNASVRDALYAVVTELAADATTLTSAWTAAWTGGVATLSHASAHGLEVGDTVLVTGYAVRVTYNGYKVITAKTSNSISYALVANPGGTDGSGTVTPITGAHRIGSGKYAGLTGGIPLAAGTLFDALKALSDGMHTHYQAAPAHNADQIKVIDTYSVFSGQDVEAVFAEIMACLQPDHVTYADDLVSNSVSGWTAAWSGGFATYSKNSAWTANAGELVVISGFSHSGYNGSFLTYSVTPSNGFTVAMSDPGFATDTGGVVELNPYYGVAVGTHKPIHMYNHGMYALPQLISESGPVWGGKTRFYSLATLVGDSALTLSITTNAKYDYQRNKWYKDVNGSPPGACASDRKSPRASACGPSSGPRPITAHGPTLSGSMLRSRGRTSGCGQSKMERCRRSAAVSRHRYPSRKYGTFRQAVSLEALLLPTVR